MTVGARVQLYLGVNWETVPLGCDWELLLRRSVTGEGCDWELLLGGIMDGETERAYPQGPLPGCFLGGCLLAVN